MATRHTHRYHVVTRGIANTLVHALTQNPSVEPISLERAREEHEHYVQLIKSLLSNSGNLHSKSVVHCIEASDMYPDCVFIEDTVVVVNDHVLINQLGAPSRRGEEEVVAEFFETNYPAKVIHYMKEMDPEATLDGGDVLTVEPAKVIYVGHSSRTNSKGIKLVIRMEYLLSLCLVVRLGKVLLVRYNKEQMFLYQGLFFLVIWSQATA
jgi:dimethylargininase